MYAVRSPTPAESAMVAELILMSDCGLLPALFGEAVSALICRLQSRTANPYSSDKTLVIAEETGGPIGAMVGSTAAETRAEELGTAALLFGWYGLGALALFPRLARAGKALKGLKPDDFYLSNIAVAPKHRGLGAGRALLSAGEAEAARRSSPQMVLDVEEANEDALAFYGRAGYRFTSRVAIDLGRDGSFRFLRLAKDLRARA